MSLKHERALAVEIEKKRTINLFFLYIFEMFLIFNFSSFIFYVYFVVCKLDFSYPSSFCVAFSAMPSCSACVFEVSRSRYSLEFFLGSAVFSAV